MMKKLTVSILICAIIQLSGNLKAASLLDTYPSLKNQIKQVKLGVYPTPVYNIKKLAEKYKLKSFYVKDDGVSGVKDGLGRVIPSGNKMRKLEFLLADAKVKGFKTVCTVGSAGSNHALETAICARQVGLGAVLLLNDQRPTSYTVRNLKLMASFAKEIIYSSVDDDAELMKQAEELCKQHNYYYIPMGGSNSLGELGYVNAMFELKDQIDRGALQEPDIIYITLGSSGTAAGIIIGAQAVGLKSKIVPVRISSTIAYKANLLADHVNQTGNWLKSLELSFPFQSVTAEDLCIEHDYAGGENTYALITPKAAQAINTFYGATGIKLEGTYSGKTLSALMDHAESGLLKGKKVLFWNTFSYGKFEEFTCCVTDEVLNDFIPIQLRHYLTDELQALDLGI